MCPIASHHEELLVHGIDRPCFLRGEDMSADIGWPSFNFTRALRDLFKFLIRAGKEELLNARQRKTMGLQDANCLQLEQMPPSVAAPGAGFRGIQQSHAPVIVKGSRRELTCSLSVGGLQCAIPAPSVDRPCQLLNCPTIHEPQYISNSVTVSIHRLASEEAGEGPAGYCLLLMTKPIPARLAASPRSLTVTRKVGRRICGPSRSFVRV